MELFVLLLFGHLFGDYLFQNDWMALNKKEKWLPCLVHCWIYTCWVYIFITDLIPQNIITVIIILVGIFLSHLVLDRTNLIEIWFRFAQGRAWKRVRTYSSKTEEDIALIAFTAIVQTVADNTIHLVLMYFLCYFLL